MMNDKSVYKMVDIIRIDNRRNIIYITILHKKIKEKK